jgi:hypothetical protein
MEGCLRETLARAHGFALPTIVSYLHMHGEFVREMLA